MSARTNPAAKPASDLARTIEAQRLAADPRASVWVSANAGTGKTHVLTTRVLRLMLAGTPPERILCLTYTKAAAAEMSKRVFDELARWVTLDDSKLDAKLSELAGAPATSEQTARARTLFAAAIETPGGLKVQTIHAFAERLLQRFPLEAGVPPGFAILDDEVALTLRRDAISDVLAEASRAHARPLGLALATAVRYAADDRFDDILAEAMANRAWLDAVPRLEFGTLTGLPAFETLLRRHFGLDASISPEAVEDALASCLSDEDIRVARPVLAGGTKTDQGLAAYLATALAATQRQVRIEALTDFFLTGEREPRTRLMTAGLKAERPDVDALLTRAQGAFVQHFDQRRALDLIAATLALHRLADAARDRYAKAKARRAGLDFEDLIVRASRLLAGRQSAEWVLYKLDGGLDHVLVDESQDTSPEQWAVVEALAREFFAGEGARADPRTLFAVGDEKQSIYSFQGAAPDMFARQGAAFEKMATASQALWRGVPLTMSFRTVAPVLRAVDQVFADPARTPGLSAGGTAIKHLAHRQGQAGLIEIWPTETHAVALPLDAWSAEVEDVAAHPSARLANRIAKTIKRWLETGERLVAQNRSLRAGDILILVHKRRPFAQPMIAALKAHGIAVAGADRMALPEQIAVEDLLSLGDFLTLPEDDLALAEVLKSPLFGLDDDALLAIAHGRPGTLWKALLEKSKSDARFDEAAKTLLRWRKAADFTPPYEFFANILDRDGMRTRMLARLGPDAADPIDEFLNLALTYDDDAPPSLTGLLAWIRGGRHEIKRDMEHGRDEVRVMTVHGAKGLEAPIVFLPDTCSAGVGGGVRGGPSILPDLARPVGTSPPFVWPVKGTSKLRPMSEAKATLAAAAAAERNRLLYVAMTRARDRLYIAGFENKTGRAPNCWYDLITEGVGANALPVGLADGTTALRLDSGQTQAHEAPHHDIAPLVIAADLPDWARRPAPREPQLAVPLAPSQLAPFETDEDGEPSPAPMKKNPARDEPASPPPAAMAHQNRFLRGVLTHALLQHLPAIDASKWPQAARAFVDARSLALPARVRASIVDETLAVLHDPAFLPLFGPGSRAEVPIVAEIPRPYGQGPALRLTGQIDRLAVSGNDVLIVDYKTNRPPPSVVEDVADAYIYQLSAYRLALAAIYPGKAIRAALLWTDGPRLMPISGAILDQYTEKLWRLKPSDLDA